MNTQISDIRKAIEIDLGIERTILFEPRLNDVLNWLKGKETPIQSINIYGMFHTDRWEIVCHWDLDKEYLFEQSEITINYFHSLI